MKQLIVTKTICIILILCVCPTVSATQTLQKNINQSINKDIKWLTNNQDQVYASRDAKKGGTLNLAILTFPLTFRVVGPDSNSATRGIILDNQLSLIGIHPNTQNIIPEIATHWAFDKDKKTMYFKLNKKAVWSDGKPVTAHDFAYTLDFMRSRHIMAPWYNDFYTKEIEKVIVYDDYTLAVVSSKQSPDLHLKLGISPTPKHFYGKLTKDFVKTYNWKIVPNTGAYQISDFKKGKYLELKRKKNWWAEDLFYFKNRFNVDKVVYRVVRDFNLQWEYFKKGKIDVFTINFPKYWHSKSKTPVVQNGYVNKIWFFNQTPQSALGMWLNQDQEIFKDKNLRYAFAHGMNIQKVIEKVLRNDYFRLEHGYVGYGEYSNNTIRARRFDLNKVQNYMNQSGWVRGPDGIRTKNQKRFSVTVTYSIDDHTPRLVVLKEEAKKAGIELKLQKLDPSATYKKIIEKKHEIAWMGWSTSLRPQFWSLYHSQNAHKPQTNNITNTDNPGLDKLIHTYRNATDAQKRIELALRIQEEIHETGSFVPTFMVPYIRHAFWRWWKLPSPPGTKLSDVLFDPFASGTGGLFWFDTKLYKQTKDAIKNKKKFEPLTIIDKTYLPKIP
jgi:microcin C transport system substrate-binding protein